MHSPELSNSLVEINVLVDTIESSVFRRCRDRILTKKQLEDIYNMLGDTKKRLDSVKRLMGYYQYDSED